MKETLPITIQDVLKARQRIRPFLRETPLRNYPELDVILGEGIQLYVKHENHLPTNAFKVRNAFSALTALSEPQRQRGVIAATRGNHGMGVAYAAKLLEIPATICVPLRNNPEKNSAIRSLGARLIEKGRDYDEAVAVMNELVETEGFTVIHSTNNPNIIAGAATLSMEILEELPSLETLVIAIGGGSQAVGAITVARALNPHLKIIGVQAKGAAAGHDSWHRRERVQSETAETFADGLATRSTYDFTFEALQEGLSDFITVTDQEIAEAVRIILKTTHNLVEGAGAAGLAGAIKLRKTLANQRVGVVLSGGNIDQGTLLKVLHNEF